MWEKLQATQQELRDTVAEFQVERDDMLDSIRELGRQVKLKSAILDRFVAPRDVEFVRWMRRSRRFRKCYCTYKPVCPSIRLDIPSPSGAD